jgi:glycoside/pentoside/hexuronide:cation symporter, GPH family
LANAAARSLLSSRTVAAYAASVGPVAILGLPFSVFLPPFVSAGGIVPIGLVGIIFALATVWDGVVDPAIGNAVDRFSRWERSHLLWLGVASPLILLLLAILAFAGDALSFWPLLLVLVLFTSSLSLFDVSHLAWGAALAQDSAHSSRLFGAREWAGKIVVLLAFAAPAFVQHQQPGLDLGGQIIAYAALAALSLPVALLAANRLPPRPIAPQPKFEIVREAGMILRFRPFRLVLAAQTLNTFGLGAMTSLFVFYAAGVLGLGSQGPVLLLISFVGGIVMTPLWVRIALHLGKPTGMVAMTLWLVAVLLASLLVPQGNFAAAAALVFALGSGFVGLLFVYGMVADIVPLYARRSGGERTGFLFALVNVTQKVGTAAGIGISYVALDAFGFDANDASASEAILRSLYVGLPVIGWSGVALIMAALARDPEMRQPLPLPATTGEPT